MAKRVLTVLGNGFEETEYVGVRDALIRAGVDVDSVSVEDVLEIRSNHNLIIHADILFENVNTKDYDALFIPGGAGVDKLQTNEKFEAVLKDFSNSKRIIAAICGGPRLLATRGLLNEHEAVCYPDEEIINDLIKGGATYLKDTNYVASGRFFTGKNMQVSVEFGFALADFISKYK